MIDPTFNTPPLAIVRLGTTIVAEAPATVPAMVGAPVSFSVSVPVRLSAPTVATVLVPVSTALPEMVPVLTNVPALIEPASVIQTALAPTATLEAAFRKPALAMPIVPAFRDLLPGPF